MKNILKLIYLYSSDPLNEKKFYNTYIRKWIVHIRLVLIASLILYTSFIYLDYIYVNEFLKELLFIRLIIFMPFNLFVFALSFMNIEKYIKIFEPLMFILSLIGGFGIIAMIYIVPEDISRMYYAGLILVVMAAYTWFKLRLTYASIVSVIIITTYTIVTIFIKKSAPSIIILNLFFLISSSIISFIACRSMEIYARKDILLESHLKNLNKKLEYLSETDGLCGIPNRRKLNIQIKNEYLRAFRSKNVLSVLMIDIDYFKKYNDFYGHLKGDDILKIIAKTLNNFARRPGDFCGRYGGEEFLLIFPEIDTKNLERLSYDIINSIRDLKIPHADSSVSDVVTISMGCVSCIINEYKKPEDIVSIADKELYKAKESGRNRFCLIEK